MMEKLTLYFIIVYAALGVVILFGIARAFYRERKYDTEISGDKIDLEELTIIIPFRNEQDRILELLSCINCSAKLPKQFIFIDDHSYDGTVDLIRKNLLVENYIILSSEIEGKKGAIEQGINYSVTRDILTFDADIQFSKHYFEHLELKTRKDMLILPVKMIGKSWRTFFETDVDLANVLSCSFAGFGNPLLASGANLFFSKAAYLNYNNLMSHKHIASGDDLFLLNNFKKNDCSIQLITDTDVSVFTSAPSCVKEYFNQRLRWLSKTTELNDLTTILSAIVQLILNIGFYALLVLAIANWNLEMFKLVFLTKFLIDFTTTAPYFYRIGKLNRFVHLLFYQFWAPILSIALALGIIFYTPTWKGRKAS